MLIIGSNNRQTWTKMMHTLEQRQGIQTHHARCVAQNLKKHSVRCNFVWFSFSLQLQAAIPQTSKSASLGGALHNSTPAPAHLQEDEGEGRLMTLKARTLNHLIENKTTDQISQDVFVLAESEYIWVFWRSEVKFSTNNSVLCPRYLNIDYQSATWWNRAATRMQINNWRVSVTSIRNGQETRSLPECSPKWNWTRRRDETGSFFIHEIVKRRI